MQGANLWTAQFDTDTDLSAATLRGAALRSVNLTKLPQFAAHLASTFGDASVTLPGGGGPESPDWPAHWPKIDLDGLTVVEGKYVDPFAQEWRKWQASLDGGPPYVPPTE